jgi:hypothetical protein
LDIRTNFYNDFRMRTQSRQGADFSGSEASFISRLWLAGASSCKFPSHGCWRRQPIATNCLASAPEEQDLPAAAATGLVRDCCALVLAPAILAYRHLGGSRTLFAVPFLAPTGFWASA